MGNHSSDMTTFAFRWSTLVVDWKMGYMGGDRKAGGSVRSLLARLSLQEP